MLFQAVPSHHSANGIRLCIHFEHPKLEPHMITDIQLKNSKPKDKDYTITVDKGLSLLVKHTGSKLWRFRYSFSGKRCMISVGKYPEISLKQARSQQQEYHDLLAQGINPSTQKKAEKIEQQAERTFKEVAVQWHENYYQQKNQRHKKLVRQRLENYVFRSLVRCQ